ncbi:hypothetical protein LSTR_LSTR006045 [Laodelphax striatellus]|uniref:Solute-binding protein family 3/N-terminal domain-containing protein n=1 Tax=Laodelphax striatellus TaxID=195883 RepID=A0A482XS82_LAOST|nr:hypothetical protein LSTR_LSTR006045 [Laodelphax striatellus]
MELRLATYMCPSLPVELYELFMSYLEEALVCDATLIYESRAAGPLTDRQDPFTKNSVDIAFMSPAAWLKMIREKRTEFAELLPATAVFKHSNNKTGKLGYYSDIVVHKDGSDHVKTFLDLRGCHWAYSDKDSLSGSVIVLQNLRELGENATFFGNTLKSGSHVQTIKMVLEKRAEAGAVDANALHCMRQTLHDHGADLCVIESLGPLPPYPIVINSRLPDDIKTKITEAFMAMPRTRLWGERLLKFGVVDFATNSMDNYSSATDIVENAKNNVIGVRYY